VLHRFYAAAAAGKAAGNAGDAGKAVNANDLHHIFDDPKHNLDGFLKSFGGNQEKAYTALENAAQTYVSKNKMTIGIFETTVNISGYKVTVRGFVSGDTVKIGTAFIK